jgi:hypothetical protein
MESLIELIFVAAAVIVSLGLLPCRTVARFVLGFGGLLLGAVGIALFVVVAYPRETLLVLGASMITGAGWGYAHITPGLADRGTHRWTVRIRRFVSSCLSPSRVGP